MRDLEEAAFEAAEKLIALLDALDGDAHLEPGTDDEPAPLGTPKEYHGSKIV